MRPSSSAEALAIARAKFFAASDDCTRERMVNSFMLQYPDLPVQAFGYLLLAREVIVGSENEYGRPIR